MLIFLQRRLRLRVVMWQWWMMRGETKWGNMFRPNDRAISQTCTSLPQQRWLGII